MIERLLETWLNKANERSFQIPFAHWLAHEGHTVIHVSRHCAMELGKDVLTIAPDGVPCAYQLKGLDGGRMTLSKWRDDLSSQLHPLVHGRIVHPSIKNSRHHRSYIVMNGDLDEEVQREIDDFNRSSAEAGQPERQVETILKGQLFQAFRELQSDFWATNLRDVKTYLELFLEDGRGVLPKAKLADLLYDSLPFETKKDKKPSVKEVSRSLAGGAVLCSAASSAFTLEQNHTAEFEAWTIYLSYTLGLSEKWDIKPRNVEFAVELAAEAMYTALARLCDELIERDGDFTEGHPLIDRPIFRVRMTLLLGLMGLYGLWIQQRIQNGSSEVDRNHLEFAQTFCDTHFRRLNLWGEYAIPQFLAWSFFHRTYDAGSATDHLYGTLVEGIAKKNAPESDDPLPNAYYEAEDILPHEFGLERKPLEDSFSGKSYYLEGLLHLFVRANFKQRAKLIFPAVTKVGFRSFDPVEPWRFFLYRNWNQGIDVETFLTPPHRWSELRTQAEECDGSILPARIKDNPLLYLALLIVMPYRVTASGLRWLASEMTEQAQDKSWLS